MYFIYTILLSRNSSSSFTSIRIQSANSNGSQYGKY